MFFRRVGSQIVIRDLLHDTCVASGLPHSAYPLSRYSYCSSLAVALFPTCIIDVLPSTLTHRPGCHRRPYNPHCTRRLVAKSIAFHPARNILTLVIAAYAHIARRSYGMERYQGGGNCVHCTLARYIVVGFRRWRARILGAGEWLTGSIGRRLKGERDLCQWHSHERRRANAKQWLEVHG